MLCVHVVFVCREGGILTCVKELLWMTVKYAAAEVTSFWIFSLM